MVSSAAAAHMAVTSSRCTNRSYLGKHCMLVGLLLLCMRGIPLCLCLGDGDGSIVGASCIESERRALLAIKADIYDPDQWLSSWGGQDCCRWRGVGCNNTTGHVVKLDLRYPYDFHAQQETGKFPNPSKINPSLFDLMHLKYLDLSRNNFSGAPIPKFIGSLVHLEYLNLSYAFFHGSIPPELGNLSNLHFLDLHSPYYYCRYHDYSCFYFRRWFLHADNLHWLSRIRSLQFLDMSLINLFKAANWLHEINMLPSLLELYLFDTNLPSIPSTLSFINLTSLRVLDLAFIDDSNRTTASRFLFNISSSLVHLDLGGSDCFNWNQRNMQHITREIFQNIRNLSYLEYLDLSCNQITADISEILATFGQHLKYLYLSVNNVNGVIPKSIGNLRSLVELFLSDNYITGEIPRSMGNLCKLNKLDISQNNINGEIADIVEGWSKCIKNTSEANSSLYGLTYLDLGYNNLSGMVLESLAQLSTLQTLRLTSNSFTGHLTEAHFANLWRLEDLDLSYNLFEVILSHDWKPSFNAQWIRMCSCQLGPKFPTWLRTQTNLTGLELSENSISDDIPPWIWDLHIIDLNLSQNSMTGKLPTSLRGQQYEYIDMSSNHFRGPLPELDPSNLYRINLSNNSFEGPIPLSFVRAVGLEILSLSNNYINGSIHPFICNLTDLLVLDLSNNNLSGRLPNCWHKSQQGAVDSQKDMLGNSQGSMSGPISLLSLHMRNNSLSGDFPLFLRYCAQLVVLDLGKNKFSGNLPLWIGESLLSLRILSLRSNSFSGNIPEQLSSLASVQVLDLACNNFSGVLPPSFGNFSAMKETKHVDRPKLSENYSTLYTESLQISTNGLDIEYTSVLSLVMSIDLSQNNLSGMIPEELVNLQGLLFLNLSNNHFTGRIPKNIGALKQLESLDLSVNNLSGVIPSTMSSMYFLSHLNLSHNNLSGKIPWGNQLQTFCDFSIYSGNPNLQRWPLPWCSNKAPSESPFQTEGQEERFENRDASEKIWFYVSFAPGFVVGLWGFIYALLIKRATRIAYFQLLDKIFDHIYVQLAICFAKSKPILMNNIQG
ncbi:receptor-like protein EIX2 [Elaeis guineensis]|uniref:receptor-like protein EIX2 n=1 Tax=Elaeis guineensis var. tenera TaxID=51953 RepID=UPI003C6D400F